MKLNLSKSAKAPKAAHKPAHKNSLELKSTRRATPKNTRVVDETLPDVSLKQKTEVAGRLSQVGMGKIEMPILLAVTKNSTPVLLPALIDAFVSLDNPEAKGIHMSRLYLELKESLQSQPVTLDSLKEILTKFIISHDGLSESAYLNLNFQLPLERAALLSGEMGYRQYPVQIRANLKDKKFDFVIGVEVLYSSTCPCSAALTRQLVQQQFVKKFKSQDKINKDELFNWLGQEESVAAVPHAQRSLARLQVRVTESASFNAVSLIDLAEKALGTPVQSAVKRIDEQEFARLNAKNLMFCEDAARKLRSAFEKEKSITDYDIYVEHQESLHPHNAVSRVVKGVNGGFSI